MVLIWWAVPEIRGQIEVMQTLKVNVKGVPLGGIGLRNHI